MVLAIVLPLLVQRWDLGNLTPAQRARIWTGASWGSAIYNFGEFSMLGWYWVTRRSSPAALLGLPTSLALFVTIRWVIDQALADAFGHRDDTTVESVVAIWAIAVAVFAALLGVTLGLEALKRRSRSSLMGIRPPSPSRSARS
jgi:hypothetical protein